MGRGQQEPDTPAANPRGQARLPKDVRDALPPAVARVWQTIAPHLPAGLHLAGGTAAAVRLGHRKSNDLDFFFHDNAVDLDDLQARLLKLGAAVDLRSPGTLRVYIGDTKIEILHADEVRAQHQLGPTTPIGGLDVADPRDLMAMKLKVLSKRGELRDYYDVKQFDESGQVSVEDGIALYQQRYAVDRSSSALRALIKSLGYLDDCDEDESLPISKTDLTAWWRKRQARVIRNLG